MRAKRAFLPKAYYCLQFGISEREVNKTKTKEGKVNFKSERKLSRAQRATKFLTGLISVFFKEEMTLKEWEEMEMKKTNTKNNQGQHQYRFEDLH